MAGEDHSTDGAAADGHAGDDADASGDGRAGDGGDEAGAGRTTVAIACQGGGSHTAFTAGVLKGLFREWDQDRYELVGISGTSGGAFNALAAWYGLVTGDADAACETLDALWRDLSATTPADRWLNDLGVWTTRLRDSGVPTPRVSPYDVPGARYGQRRIAEILERHVDFDAIPELCATDRPELVVGTVDVNGGVFETFTNENVTAEAVLASAAVPDLFRGVELHGHLHWDGLFSQNPPVMDLMTVPAERKPDELWVIQINPQEREENPRTLEEIADRRNELSGNLSLNQELRFIEWVNDWIDAGHLPADGFTHTEIRKIELEKRYTYATKADRRPSFVRSLIERGEARAAAFLADLPDGAAAERGSPADGVGSQYGSEHGTTDGSEGAGRADESEDDAHGTTDGSEGADGPGESEDDAEEVAGGDAEASESGD
jgi:NTE family protein